jgi:hypothetical protein
MGKLGVRETSVSKAIRVMGKPCKDGYYGNKYTADWLHSERSYSSMFMNVHLSVCTYIYIWLYM